MKLLALKLSSSEELIGRVKDGEFDDILSGGLSSFELHDPRLILAQPGPQGLSLSFIPVLFSARDQSKITVNGALVSATARVDDEMETEYIKQVSGIQLAN